jgi:hypothetical protein
MRRCTLPSFELVLDFYVSLAAEIDGFAIGSERRVPNLNDVLSGRELDFGQRR